MLRMEEEQPNYFQCGVCGGIVPYNEGLTCENCEEYINNGSE